MDIAAAALLGIGLVLLWAFGQTIVLPLQPLKLPLPPLDEETRQRALRLEAHVRAIASRPHNIAHYADLEQAARYIEGTLRSFGLRPLPQAFEVDGVAVRNIELVFAEQRADAAAGAGTIVIGAHYDSAEDFPGANDNGTGVAALLEICRELAQEPLATACAIRLVFFVNDEQPYGKTENMGALRHARALLENGERIAGMIALETLGAFPDRPGSQRLPFPFNWIYSDRGNFVAFVGLPGARRFLSKALAAFRTSEVFPSTGTIVPSFVEGADLSDHWAYAEIGVPALMVTDTAPYRNPFYHQVYDLPDTVDYASLARITAGLTGMVRALARN